MTYEEISKKIADDIYTARVTLCDGYGVLPGANDRTWTIWKKATAAYELAMMNGKPVSPKSLTLRYLRLLHRTVGVQITAA